MSLKQIQLKQIQLKQIISDQYDTYLGRLSLINDKDFNIRLSNDEKNIMKNTSEIGDKSTILSFLKDFYNLDKLSFYKFVHKQRTELGEFIIEHGNLNGLKQIYENLIANKQNKIIRSTKICKIDNYYRIKKMKAKLDYEELIRKLDKKCNKEKINIWFNPNNNLPRNTLSFREQEQVQVQDIIGRPPLHPPNPSISFNGWEVIHI